MSVADSRKARRTSNRPCLVDGCSSMAHARGMCKMHYDHHRNSGDLLSFENFKPEGIAERFQRHVKWATEPHSALGTRCLLWTGSKMRSGYGRMSIKHKDYFAHRIACEIAGINPGKMFVLHHCDNPSCVNVKHLFLGTAKDNMMDMDAKGRRITTPTISDEDVLKMREMRRAGKSRYEIGKAFNVTANYAWEIARGAKRSNVRC